jgi:DNA polymerase III alpha subunit
VHGLPKEEIDRLTAYPERETAAGALQKHIGELAQRIAGFPHERSIHAGGVLISEKPIFFSTALDLPPKGLPVTQWDMYTAEKLGFEKWDILSQRGIGHIQEAVEIIRKNHGVTIDIHQTEQFKTDEKARSLLRNGETIGCFYIESPAMRSLLKKLHCDDYLTLVAASSIIRPGVARSGMMRKYIERFHHPESFRYLHPVLKEQLHETYGVMVYQEDVLKVCHHYAGLDLADADILRRAMSGKYRGKQEFLRIKDKFFEKSRAKGRPEKVTREVWRQIESFAGYSFSKAHSASYAVESFQSLYLKAHFPLEFMVAVINNFGGFYPTWVYFNEIRRLGGRIHLPCVNRSSVKTGINGKDVFMGFIHIKGLERRIMERIVSERKAGGNFTGLEDFVRRVTPGIEQLTLLIRAGALRFTGKNKPQLLWESHMQIKSAETSPETLRLFPSEPKKFRLPPLESNTLQDAKDETELLGFPVSLSLFDLLQTRFRGEIKAAEMAEKNGKTVRMTGWLVTRKHVRTQRNDIMDFATFLDDRGDMFDTVHFPATLKKYPFRGNGIYLLSGQVVTEFGYASLRVEKMAKLPLKPDPE